MKSGWVKLHTQIKNHWLWKDPEYLRAWIDMLFMANWKPTKRIYKNDIIIIDRGAFPVSMRKLMRKWNWSQKRLYRFIKLLKSDTMITTNNDHDFTLIKIVNYEQYQVNKKAVRNTLGDTLGNTLGDTLGDTLGNTLGDTTRRCIDIIDVKDLKEKEMGKEKENTPPSLLVRFFALYLGKQSSQLLPQELPNLSQSRIIRQHLEHKSLDYYEPYLEEMNRQYEAGSILNRPAIRFFFEDYLRYDPNRPNKHTKVNLNDFKTTAVGGHFIGYCADCGVSDFYDKFEVWQDSRCCQSGLLPKKVEMK